LAVVSLSTGAAATFLDGQKCFDGDSAACVGFGLSIPGTVATFSDLLLEGLLPEAAQTALDYLGLGTGAAGFGWDVGATLSGALTNEC
jgi:hypothetical protein